MSWLLFWSQEEERKERYPTRRLWADLECEIGNQSIILIKDWISPEEEPGGVIIICFFGIPCIVWAVYEIISLVFGPQSVNS